MAFQSTEVRFGPDLDRYKQGYPNPCTYTPPDDSLEVSCGTRSSGTFGYHRPDQQEVPSPFAVAAETSPAVASTLKAMADNSLANIKKSYAPDPWKYSPEVNGQFRRVYTTQEIEAERKRSSQQRQRVKNHDPMSAQELHIALGPGSYEVDHVQNQEAISSPFTFSREKRHGILEHTTAMKREGSGPGPTQYHVESNTVIASASTLASTPLRSKHASSFLMRVRSDDQLRQQRKKGGERYSNELAKSYQDLSRSVQLNTAVDTNLLQRLERRLASPDLRAQTLKRFEKETMSVEAYRRGPGSYATNSSSKAECDSEDDRQRSWCQLSPLPMPGHKQNSSFGRVPGRDLLASMITAGHVNAHTIGPGVYDARSSSFTLPTHNIGYKQQMQRAKQNNSTSNGRSKNPESATGEDVDEETKNIARLSKKEMWKVMRQGPSMPS